MVISDFIAACNTSNIIFKVIDVDSSAFVLGKGSDEVISEDFASRIIESYKVSTTDTPTIVIYLAEEEG